MLNPLLNQRKSILTYFMAWTLFAGFHAFVLYFYFSFEAEKAAVDALIFNTLFAITGTGLWYVVRYMTIDGRNIYWVLFNHLLAGSAIAAGWVFASWFLLSWLFRSDQNYRQLLETSLPVRFVTGLLFYGLMVMVFYMISYYNDLREKMNQKAELEKNIREAELNLLKSQINPHFLFNSLNSIHALTMSDPGKASDMIIELSDFLRYSLKSTSTGMHTLKAELENVIRYLNIEKIRFSEKLSFSIDTDEACHECQIPQMILQPLFENAVKHGVGSSTDPVHISVDCHLHDDILELTISNNFSSDSLQVKGNRMGLDNIRMRLTLTYQAEGLLQTRIRDNLYEVRLLIPQMKA